MSQKSRDSSLIGCLWFGISHKASSWFWPGQSTQNMVRGHLLPCSLVCLWQVSRFDGCRLETLVLVYTSRFILASPATRTGGVGAKDDPGRQNSQHLGNHPQKRQSFLAQPVVQQRVSREVLNTMGKIDRAYLETDLQLQNQGNNPKLLVVASARVYIYQDSLLCMCKIHTLCCNSNLKQIF